MKRLVCWMVAALFSATAYSQSRGPSPAVLYEGERLITGDGSAPVERGAFVVQNGHITADRQSGRRCPRHPPELPA